MYSSSVMWLLICCLESAFEITNLKVASDLSYLLHEAINLSNQMCRHTQRLMIYNRVDQWMRQQIVYNFFAYFQSSFVGAIAIGDLVKSTLGPKGMVKYTACFYNLCFPCLYLDHRVIFFACYNKL